jgi:hypothetical protein
MNSNGAGRLGIQDLVSKTEVCGTVNSLAYPG